MKFTLSVIKADIGGYVGHSSSHPEILAENAKKESPVLGLCPSKQVNEVRVSNTNSVLVEVQNCSRSVKVFVSVSDDESEEEESSDDAMEDD